MSLLRQRPADVSAAATPLERELRRVAGAEVRFDAGSRGAYSTDASNYRQVPIGVVVPATTRAGVDTVAACRRHGAPVLSRGGGTSLSGQCTNEAVVIDWSKHCNRLLSVDRTRRRCVVEPGIVLDELNRQLAPHGLRYGPEPASHPNCTIGGMIGNNSCGATAQRTGKVVDNTPRLEVLLYDGTRFWCERTDDEAYAQIIARGGRQAEIYEQLRQLVGRYGSDIRRAFPDIPRRVSGYNLDSLLPEHGFDVAGLLVGSESTLVTVLRAELSLVPVLRARTLVILGFPSIGEAGDAVAEVVSHEPIALEGFDQRLVQDERLKHEHLDTLRQLPDGRAWLMVQFGGDTVQESDERARRMLDALEIESGRCSFLDDPEREDAFWRVREGVLGASSDLPDEPQTFEGWDDSAVPPERLGDYLRDLERLYDRHGYSDEELPAVYGHFGQGCVHSRIPFDLAHEAGVADFRRFLEEATELVVGYGGSISGEHGDGQRGELLARMFGERVMEAFGALKAIFDPGDRMNPGKVVSPRPLDANLRMAGMRTRDLGRPAFSYPEDEGSFARAAGRCVGVGKCRQHTTDGTVMCPSYQVTLEEEHSTRGRARLLFEMLGGHPDGPIQDGWRSDAVADALDLCLACKGCKRDCPVGVDMATYKAEFLFHHWHGRLRPRSHYALGWLPLLAHGAARLHAAGMVNAVTARPRLRRPAAAVAGLEQRPLPRLATESLQCWAARQRLRAGPRGTVLLWPDTFTNTMSPEIGRAAVRLLQHAGWGVEIPAEPLCCGLTWISTGQLSVAKRVLRRTAIRLRDHLRSGGLVVGLEPSCTSVFRSDAVELLPGEDSVRRLAEQTVTLAELLTGHTPGWEPPAGPSRPGTPSRALVQVHCHQHAVLGWDADAELLDRAGVDARRLDSGCCGLAGNFGFEPGHLDVSRACAERALLPAIRQADPRTAILADGFSCRTQIAQLDSGGRRAIHLAQLLAPAGGP